MKRFTMFACLALTLVFAMNSFASELPQLMLGHDSVYHGGNAEFTKSGRDTVFLIGPWGSGAAVNGQFESEAKASSWNGWTHWDVTQPTVTHWAISTYAADVFPGGAGNKAAFCGDETFPVCNEADVIGGYGNNWNDVLEFSHAVADPTASCTLGVSGVFSSNSEPGYDFLTTRYMLADAPVVKEVFDGVHSNQAFTYTQSYSPTDYVGDNNDEVRFQFVFKSDGGFSDEDCSYSGNGGAQVDDLTVVVSNGGYSNTEDFEGADMGDWSPVFPAGVGDFSGLWTGLEDFDPCNTNYTTQVAFINDGTQVAGVEGSPCQAWCYGPGGYIVNTTGGATSDGHLLIAVESPVLNLPGGEYSGFELTFGSYRHEELSADSPGIFYQWNVRSAATLAEISSAAWNDRNFVYYGGPDYIRAGDIVSDLMEPGAAYGQVQLLCNELGYVWGYDGDNGTPAPYFDNVRFTAFSAFGPGMSTREIDLAQDNFSEIGEEVDFSDLAINNVRFDSTQSKAVGQEEHNIPGDSILCSVASVRAGGQLVSNRIVYVIDPNPVFDSVRTEPLTGSSNAVRQGTTDKYYYDLPDSGLLFPGDVLHYYFEATDEVAHADAQTATIPANIDGFGDFSNPTAYNTAFQVHALPTVDADGNYPEVLFWNDFANRGGENEWYTALNNLGLQHGVHYDSYYTNGPSSGQGNGLGGRATYNQIQDYTDLLYTSGDLGAYTISNGDYSGDAGRDIHLLNDWVSAGAGRDLFLTGDDLVSDLVQSGALTSTFVADMMNVNHITKNIKPLINNQATPLVLPEAGNSVFFTTPSWVAYGGCFGINSFDAVEAGDGAERLARFTNPSGAADYSYSAATLNAHDNDRVISMPYDFMYVYTDANNPIGGGLSARTSVLKEVLAYFQVGNGTWVPTDVPGAEKFSAKNYPNPFNPTTKIEFNMPKAGHLTLKIFNVRGELVKTLIDETRAAGADHVMWDGTNSQGSSVSSGVYFYEARTAGEVQVSKMALVK